MIRTLAQRVADVISGAAEMLTGERALTAGDGDLIGWMSDLGDTVSACVI